MFFMSIVNVVLEGICRRSRPVINLMSEIINLNVCRTMHDVDHK